MRDCIFCKIIKKDIPSDIIYEDEKFVVFSDINPLYRIHCLIVPREHIPSVNNIDNSKNEIFSGIFSVARKIAKKFGIEKTGYRLVVNNGKHAGQEVNHFHMHIFGGERLRRL